MNIVIEVNTRILMYRTFVDGELYDARDGFKHIEDIIGDAVCTFLYDPAINCSKGFSVEFIE